MGYNDLLLIPAGATNIKITEVRITAVFARTTYYVLHEKRRVSVAFLVL